MDQKDYLSVENLVNMANDLAMTPTYLKMAGKAADNMLKSIESGGSSAVPQREIYAMIDGRQQGPFSLGELAEHIRSGAVTPETYIWKAGMKDWKPAREAEDIMPIFGTVPPQFPNM